MSRPSVFDLSSQSHFQQHVADIEKIERFCCFTRDHKRYPSSASALSFYRSFAFLQGPPIFSSGMEHLPFSAYIRNTHGIFTMPALSLVIKYALTKSVINNKNPTKICPKFKVFPSPVITHTIRGRGMTTHSLGIFPKPKSACRRTPSSSLSRRELGRH